MKVCKFGGSSVADAAQMLKVMEIVRSDPRRRVVVVSAPGKRRKGDDKVTDLLISCAADALAGRDPAENVERVVARYESIRADLGLDEALVEGVRAELLRRLATFSRGGSDITGAILAAALDAWLAARAPDAPPPECFACGPAPMLRAVDERALSGRFPAWLSLDRRMACGVGTCFGCTQTVRDGASSSIARVCVDGPVFPAGRIVWDA